MAAMPTECNRSAFAFPVVDGHAVVAGFDGGQITSDAGALPLGATDRAIRLVDRFADCSRDARQAHLVEHAVRTPVGPRIFGLCLASGSPDQDVFAQARAALAPDGP